MNRFRALFLGFATAASAAALAAYNGVFEGPSDAPAAVAATPTAAPAEAAKMAPPAAEKPVEVAKADPSAPVEQPAPAVEKAPAPVVETAPAAAIIAPSFNMLRAEPDGSLLVAGQGVPNSEIELLAGATLLGKTKAEANGDFAIVLSDPLKPGDYSLVLRTTNPDGTVATSVQTATVSIPETVKGQVLALVEEPGKASRIITAPVAEKPAAPEEEAANVAATAPAEPEAPAAEPAPAVADKPADEKAAETAAATPEEAVKAPADQAPAAVAAAEPVKPAQAEIAVEAVEIEGNKIFIAGNAVSGSTIRLYANEILLGETKATPNNRFLLEVERELPVGDYRIRADSLGPDGVTVLTRAVVPFQREAGETVVAVAAPKAPEAPAVEPAKSAEPAVEAAPAPDAPALAEAPAAEAAKPADAVETAAASAPAETVAAAKTPETEVAAVAAQEPAAAEPAVTAPALTKVDTSVIIRRGDSLWRISRRIYGRGVRYSTIYLANKGQVEDPDMIWPGQVMMIPEKTAEGEAANMAEIEKRKATSSAK